MLSLFNGVLFTYVKFALGSIQELFTAEIIMCIGGMFMHYYVSLL